MFHRGCTKKTLGMSLPDSSKLQKAKSTQKVKAGDNGKTAKIVVVNKVLHVIADYLCHS